MKTSQHGFTLIEMIGVMSIIAILASVATPKIFDAIEDAKVSAYIQEANSIKLAITKYYKDTGTWPRHIPSHANSRFHNLLVNDADGSGAPIAGWDGPYIERELTHQITKGSYQDVISTDRAALNCDIDGDGNRDGSFLVYRADNIDDSVAKKISNIIDSDGDISTGTKSWKAAGKVKRYGANSDHRHILLYCIAST